MFFFFSDLTHHAGHKHTEICWKTNIQKAICPQITFYQFFSKQIRMTIKPLKIAAKIICLDSMWLLAGLFLGEASNLIEMMTNVLQELSATPLHIRLLIVPCLSRWSLFYWSNPSCTGDNNYLESRIEILPCRPFEENMTFWAGHVLNVSSLGFE